MTARSRIGFKRAVLAISAAGVALVLGAAAVELWTRLTWNPVKGVPGFYLSDPVRIQRLAAGYSGWFAGVPVRINQLELRDAREYSLAKPPHTFRILVLGDSVTFGHGSVYEHTFPYLLEQQLRSWRPEVNWQVWNAAVPGYNTSQELAQLLEIGPRFQPDLVIVGFFWNDAADNFCVRRPGAISRAASATLSFLYRHLYSIEFYKRAYLQLAWKLSSADSYRLRVQHLAEERSLLADLQQIRDLEGQQLTPFVRLTEDEVASVRCSSTGLAPDWKTALEREKGWPCWLEAVRRFQQMNRSGEYRVVFFLNLTPLVCPTADVFFDGGSAELNGFYLRILGDGAPAVSTYDEFRHLRPSQMPFASEHAIGNSNLVKARVLFDFLRREVLPVRISEPNAW
jgi:GDSL-like Lipase/Acylhydrolase family